MAQLRMREVRMPCRTCGKATRCAEGRCVACQAGHKAPRNGKIRAAFARAHAADGCAICGSRVDLQVDHVVPASRGGREHPDNFQMLCGAHNARKGNRAGR